MKTTTIIGLCMALVLLCGTAAADWNVTWTPVKESIINKEYMIEVQNLQDVKRDVNISSFFAETNFDISGLSDVEFYEWAEVQYNYTVYHYDEVNHSVYCPVNGTWNNWTEQVYNWTEIIESEKLDWDDCKAQLFKENGTTKEDNYGFINIPKFGSEDDGDGTYNGTKVFKLTFRTPIVYDGSYGSVGKVALLLDGEEHHPYWNTSWSTRKEVILTGHENLSLSFDNPIEDGHIYNTSTYTRYNALDYIAFGRNEHPSSIYRGYIEWDISALPSDAEILNVKLKYHGQSNALDGHIHEMMDTRPSVSGNQDVYNEIGEGTVYADITGFPVMATTQEINLGSNAVTDLEASITNGWFAIGLQGDGEAAGMAIEGIYSEEYISVNPKPTLYIEYSSEQDGVENGITDYQILLNVSYETEMQADFDDLRFCNDTHEIDSWLESKVDSSYALVWVEFPTTPANGTNQTYYKYYGNAGASSNWDGGETFLQWHGSATADFMDAATVSPTNVVFEGKIKRGGISNVMWGLSNHATVGDDYLTIQSYSTSRYVKSGNEGSDTSQSESPNLDDGVWYKAKITCDGTTVYGYIDDNEIGTGGITTNLPNENLGLYMHEFSGYAAQEWSFARKYAANPPTYVFGDTQHYAGSIHYNVSSPYNHTIDSNGAIAVNHSIVAADDINWAAAAVSTDCYLIVSEYNLTNITIANFTLETSSLDWLLVTNLTGSSTYWLQFANGTFIEAQTSTATGEANFTTNTLPDDYQIVYHPQLNITLHSVSPETIHTNYTGAIQVNYIVVSADLLNLSTLAMLYGVNYTTTGDMHSYVAVPPNSIASEGIYRAPNRNTTPYLSWEDNATITEGNVWQWGGGDNSSWWITKTPINSTHTWINATGIPEHVFQSSFYLKKTSIYSAPKTSFNINSQQGLIIKMWDNEAIRGRSVDYILNMYFDSDWQSTIPTSPIEIWGFNSSFNPDTDDPATSEWGAKIVEWDGNRWVNHSWVPGSNASYAYPLIFNASSFPVVPDEINYIYLKSATQSSKSYVLNATNHDPGICNITYAQTESFWTYSELADESTPVAYTPSFFATFVRDDEEFLHHMYIADDQGEWAHSGINNISIGVSHFPVSASSFDYFNVTCPTFGHTIDTGMGSTYDNGYIHIGIYCYADPDGGTVSHNITLHYVNETLAGVINDTFQTTSSGLYEINFTTSPYYSTTEAYVLKCVSTDDEGSVATTWLDSFFTLSADGTQGYYMNGYLMFWGMNDIPTLYATVANNSLISYDAGSDIYTMHVPFFKSKCNDTFRFNETVRLESLNTEDVAYFRFGGETIFDNANIHGWNTVSDAVAPSTDTYRGYVYTCCRTTGNITNSNLSHLGSDVYQQEGLNFIDNTMDYLIYNTTFSHNSRGIIMEECENITISHCDIHDNVETGIGVYYSDNMVVENCTISDSSYDPGLYLYESTDNVIRYNTISDCVDYGMRIRSNSNNNTLIGNIITGSGVYDYYFSSAAINNTIRDPASATDKIRVTSTSEVNIENTDNSAFSEDSSNSTYAYQSNFSMSVTGVSHTFDIMQRNMTITPNTSSVKIWNLEWNHIVKFNASNVSGSPYVWFNITHQPWAYSNISIYRNDTIYSNDTADPSGHIAYNYSGGWSEHWFEFSPENIAPDKPTLIIPANGATGTSTNPSLRVMVTDYNDYDLLNVTFYTQGGAQIGSTQTGITNGSTASVVWSGRSYSTTYYWYAVAHDGKAPTQSDTWNFRTQGGGSGSSHVIAITGCTDWSGNAGNQVYIDFGCTGETAGATFTTNATNGSIDSSTGVYTWNTATADAGVYTWRFNVENVYSVSDYCDVTITVYHHASPTNIAATTGNFWVNHTWDGNGFMDSYNVSVNDVWVNGSDAKHSYHVRYPHAWSNITVAAFNDTTGLSSVISNDVQVSNNLITLTNYTTLMLATAGDTVTVDMNHEDLDGDTATYYCSRMDLFTDFNTADGTGQYTNAVNGTHEVIFGVTDGYGWSNQTITIEVGTVHPLELDEETPLILFVVLVVLLFGSLFYIYHAASYVAKIVTALISTWMSFMLSNMAVSGNVVLNYAELSAGDVFIYGAHSIQIAALSHFFMFTGVVSALFMLVFAIKLVIDTYLDMQEKRKADEEWDGVEQS